MEVIERAHGPGTWQKDDSKFGPNSWPYSHGDKVIFPVDWALKEIMDGESQSVAKKYQELFTEGAAGSKWGLPSSFRKR